MAWVFLLVFWLLLMEQQLQLLEGLRKVEKILGQLLVTSLEKSRMRMVPEEEFSHEMVKSQPELKQPQLSQWEQQILLIQAVDWLPGTGQPEHGHGYAVTAFFFCPDKMVDLEKESMVGWQVHGEDGEDERLWADQAGSQA